MKITLAMLQSAGACSDQVDAFRTRFGDAVTITEDLCISVAGVFDWGWAGLYRGFSRAELWGSSSAVLSDSSRAVLHDSSNAVLHDSSSAVLRGSSRAKIAFGSLAVVIDRREPGKMSCWTAENPGPCLIVK